MPFRKHMPHVQEYLRRLEALQETWGNLSLLSQMTGSGTDLAETRRALESLSQDLVAQLAAETLRKTMVDLGGRAQVAIDVLVRNLFERTADIGFLSLDDDVVRFARQCSEGTQDAAAASALRARFAEYAAKYSVYRNVVLLAADGRLLTQLVPGGAVPHSADPLVARTLAASNPYVETFAVTDLVQGAAPTLIYSFRVEEDRRPLAVLALCFDFEDEMRGIFTKLLKGEEDWTVLVLLDAQHRVIASSDAWQIPIGAALPPAGSSGRLRFAGREYLAATRASDGYQGYRGPQGWHTQALIPLEHAFEPGPQAQAESLAQASSTTLPGAGVFSPELRAIPAQANRIQRDLNRAVWNGNLRQASDAADASFAGMLLREISATGRRTQDLFEHSIGSLQQTVVSSLLQDQRFRASLAADILDRNLYERANDCRWWALNGTLRACLEGSGTQEAASAVLAQINALYTVYDHLMLFDRDCRVVAVSRSSRAAALGQRLTAPWAGEALGLRDSQSWAVSAFESFEHYDGQPTWIFAAAIRAAGGAVCGGIAIVFDTAVQAEAMLRDVLPAGAESETGIAVFVDETSRVIAATAGYAPGDTIDLPAALLRPDAGGVATIVDLTEGQFAAGARRCEGYREFAGLAVTAILLRRLGDSRPQVVGPLPHLQFEAPRERREHADRVTTFACAGDWFAIQAAQVVEAIESHSITRIPGSSPWYPGLVRFQDGMIPVIDLAQWNGGARRTDTNTIVVVESGESRIGLLVDQLGDVIQIAQDDIVDVDVGMERAGTAPNARVVRFGGVHAATVPLVDVARMLTLLQ